jgi:hypothetical protein
MTRELGREVFRGFTAAALARLTAYRWPGNVRELKKSSSAASIADHARMRRSTTSSSTPFGSPHRECARPHLRPAPQPPQEARAGRAKDRSSPEALINVGHRHRADATWSCDYATSYLGSYLLCERPRPGMARSVPPERELQTCDAELALNCAGRLQSIRAKTCSRFAKNRCHPPWAPW